MQAVIREAIGTAQRRGGVDSGEGIRELRSVIQGDEAGAGQKKRRKCIPLPPQEGQNHEGMDGEEDSNQDLEEVGPGGANV